MVITDKVRKENDQRRKQRECAPQKIKSMIDAINKMRAEIGDEVISDALLSLASACKVNPIEKTAKLSKDKLYRYDLSRFQTNDFKAFCL